MKLKKAVPPHHCDWLITLPLNQCSCSQTVCKSASCPCLQPEFANDGYTNYFVHKPIFAQNDLQAVSISSLAI